MAKYEQRVVIMATLLALTADVLTALTDALSKPVSQRVAAFKAIAPSAWRAVLAAFDGNAKNAARQLAFHLRAYPYVVKAAAEFAIDGGIKRGQATYVVRFASGAYGVLVAPEGQPARTRVIARYTGTLADDKARTAYAAEREGMPYVVKARGKFAVSTNGAHVNARLVSVDEYSNNSKAFDVYRASGRKGQGRAWRALDGNSGGKVTGKRGKGTASK